MAYTISTGGVVSVIFGGTLFGQQVMNTFHYKYEGPIIADGLAFLNNLAGVNPQMQGNMLNWQDCCALDVMNNRIYVQWIHPVRYRARNFPMANPTGSGDACVTSNTAAVFTLVADQATRHGIGNKHVPGVPLAKQDSGFLTPDYVVKLQTIGDSMSAQVPIMGGILIPVIYNRALPASSLAVIGAETNPAIRVQRRRTVGLGK